MRSYWYFIQNAQVLLRSLQNMHVDKLYDVFMFAYLIILRTPKARCVVVVEGDYSFGNCCTHIYCEETWIIKIHVHHLNWSGTIRGRKVWFSSGDFSRLYIYMFSRQSQWSFRRRLGTMDSISKCRIIRL
jgi:hypothetical protein